MEAKDRVMAKQLYKPVPRGNSTKAVVFLGGGHITNALIAGLRLAGYTGEIVVYDRNPHKLRQLQSKFQVKVARDLREALEQDDMLIAAVRPVSVPALRQQDVHVGTP